MRVLFVSKTFPRDLRTSVHGVYQRMATFVEAIGRIAELDMLFYVPAGTDVSSEAIAAAEHSLSNHWNVTVRLSLCAFNQSETHSSKWKRYGAPALSFFRHEGHSDTSGPAQVGALEACLSRKPDAILAHELASICPLLLTSRPLPPVFFDLNDIAHVVLMRAIEPQSTWKDRVVQYARLPSICWGERRAIRLAHTTFVCSDLDREYLNRWGARNVVAIPNTVESTKLLPVASAPTLLFVGSYRYRPNAQAAEFLLRQIWPRVLRAMPNARLIIAGGGPENINGYEKTRPDVEFTGFVDELESLYGRARVVCAPILSGGGTRVKIIEAGAYGRPIVATSLGVEGIVLRDSVELMIRDDPTSFAAACVTLLRDEDRCRQLGTAAHAAVGRLYLRDNVLQVIQSCVQDSQPSSGDHRGFAAVAKA